MLLCILCQTYNVSRTVEHLHLAKTKKQKSKKNMVTVGHLSGKEQNDPMTM